MRPLTSPRSPGYSFVFGMSGRTTAGRYALKREIGRGGMGLVWEAFDPTLRRRVALKLMSPEHVASIDARRRFEREATAIAHATLEALDVSGALAGFEVYLDAMPEPRERWALLKLITRELRVGVSARLANARASWKRRKEVTSPLFGL